MIIADQSIRFVRGGPNLIVFSFFLVDGGIDDPNSAINGPPSGPPAKKRRFAGGQMMANIECWLGSFVIFQGDPDQYCKDPYIFFYFSGVVWTPCPLSGFAHVFCRPTWAAIDGQRRSRSDRRSSLVRRFPRLPRVLVLNIE